MIELLLRLIARFMSRIRVNRVEWFDDGGVSVIVKRRRSCASVVIWLGNRFLALAQSGVQMFVHTRAWMAWEQHCALLLYADRPPVLAERARAGVSDEGSEAACNLEGVGSRLRLGRGHVENRSRNRLPTPFGTSADAGQSLRVPALPGTSLRRLLEQGDFCLEAFVAAARELRRAHRMQCSFFSAGWSHGDLHLDNILYDAATDRAFLIDFDTRHQRGIAENRRHADDLKVLLLELIASPGDQWRELATAFLSEYGKPRLLNELAGQLAVPRGFAKILWYTRTGCLRKREIAPRLQMLREIIRQVVSDAKVSDAA